MARARREPNETQKRRARRALAKRAEGRQLSEREEDAVDRLLSWREEQDRWQHYADIPKKHYVEMSGRQHKILDEQASRYGMPILGDTVDLRQLLRWLHDFLAANAKRLLATEKKGSSSDGSLPALERLREAKADHAEMDLQERTGVLVPAPLVHDLFGRAAGVLRKSGESLQRHFGEDAAEILYDAIDNAEREVLGRIDGLEK